MSRAAAMGLLGETTFLLRRAVELRLELAKVEAGRRAGIAGGALALTGLAAGLALVSLGAFAVAAGAWLVGLGLSPASAALAVAAGGALLALCALLAGRGLLRRAFEGPRLPV